MRRFEMQPLSVIFVSNTLLKALKQQHGNIKIKHFGRNAYWV